MWDELTSMGMAGAYDRGLVDYLAEQLVPRLGHRGPQEKIRALLEVLTELRAYSPRAAQRLRELASDGRLLLHWDNSDRDVPPYSYQAWLLFTYLREVPDAKLPAAASDEVKKGHESLRAALTDPTMQTVDAFTLSFAQSNAHMLRFQ